MNSMQLSTTLFPYIKPKSPFKQLLVMPSRSSILPVKEHFTIYRVGWIGWAELARWADLTAWNGWSTGCYWCLISSCVPLCGWSTQRKLADLGRYLQKSGELADQQPTLAKCWLNLLLYYSISTSTKDNQPAFSCTSATRGVRRCAGLPIPAGIPDPTRTRGYGPYGSGRVDFSRVGSGTGMTSTGTGIPGFARKEQVFFTILER